VRLPIGGGFLWRDLTGQAGGTRAVHRGGKLELRPRSEPKLSHTPAAIYQRLMYAVIEWLWLSLTKDERNVWLRSCTVPGLTGRDLFGRCNWYQVDWYDKWMRAPPACQPHSAPHHVYPSAVAISELMMACLGGPWTEHTQDLQRGAVRYKSASEFRASLAAAVAAAYASVAAKPWGAYPVGESAGHWLLHNKYAQWWASVSWLESDWWWPGLTAFRFRDAAAGCFHGEGTTWHWQGAGEVGPASYGPVNGWVYFSTSEGLDIKDGGFWKWTDGTSWHPLEPLNAWPYTDGWRGELLRFKWWQRGSA